MPTPDYDAEYRARIEARRMLDEARQKYVEKWIVTHREEKLKEARALETTKEAILAALKRSSFDKVVRQVLLELQTKFYATGKPKDGIPFDGEQIEGHTPALIIDHLGQAGFRQRFEISGLRYSFRTGLDEVTIIATICRGKRNRLYPVFSLTHTDGRSHRIDWTQRLENPNSGQLRNWLIDQITGLISKRYPLLNEPVTLKAVADWHVPASATRSFYPDEE